MFGNPAVFPIKIIWDYTYYWGILCQMFFQQRLTDVKVLGTVSNELEQCKALNFAMQAFLRDWSTLVRGHNPSVMFDHASLDWFAELNRGLRDQLDDTGFCRRICESARRLQLLALEIVDIAQSQHAGLGAEAINSLVTAELRATNAAPMLADIPEFTPAYPSARIAEITLQH